MMAVMNPVGCNAPYGGPPGQLMAPMRNFLVPHSVQMDRVAGRPFFMVTASMSLDAVLALHFTQKTRLPRTVWSSTASPAMG